MERNYPKIQITDKAARSLRSGHPWVYADEVLQADAACVDGQIVDVTTRSGHWLGAGFYNSASKIRVRVLSRNANDRFDEAFWARRIRYAVDYRRTVIGQDFDNCRLIFGEADGFPGLTVDRFGQILVAQVLSLGMELRKQQLFALLLQTLHADGAQIDAIYERNDVKLRQKEGMEQGTGFVTLDGLRTDLDGHVTIRENAIRGYKEINLKAMRILPRGGYLATCSCSHFMTDDRFRAMLADAAKDAQVSLRQIEARQQGPDHPILWNVPETDYLKFYLFQIV